MVLDSVNIVYILSNLFGTYIIYKFMKVFFTGSRGSRRIEYTSYALYFLVTSLVYLLFKSPLLNLATNVIAFVLLTLNYIATWKLRLAATLLIYAIMITVEAVVVLGIEYLNMTVLNVAADIELIIILISVKIVSFVVILALSNFKMLRNQVDLSSIHWVAIFTVPIGTLFTTVLLLTLNTTYEISLILIGVTILFAVNAFVFYLYDVLSKVYQQKLEKELLQQQNDAYIKQIELINESQENVRRIRHDMKNHISVVHDLIERNETFGALEYIKTIVESLELSKMHIDSGNPEMDSILNYKIQDAKKSEIDVDINVSIPERIKVNPFDLSTILGNLLDNAIEATAKVDNDRKITGSIEFERNVLYIRMTNPYVGKLDYTGYKLKTTRKDKENHGFGLSNVQKSIDKYNGMMDINPDGSHFNVDVLIYVPSQV